MSEAPRERRSTRAATAAYIAAVAALAVALGVWSGLRYGLPDPVALLVFLLFAVLQVLLPDAVVEGRVRVSLSGVILVAGQAIVGPAGVAVIGALLGAIQYKKAPLRNRIFNTAQFSLHGVVGGIVFLVVGGTTDPDSLRDVGAIVVGLAVPLLLADLAQAVTNLLAVVGVMRVAEGIPMRPQALAVARGTGLAHIGYTAIALIMVVLWKPAGLGPAAAVIALAPLVVAQWAYRQHAEELEGQRRALEVLVAALEAKVPHLSGHSARVAELSAHMAEHLGLRPQQVADTRVAGMLHDLGQTSLPTRTARGIDLTGASVDLEYPERGAAMLDDLHFLHGALDPIRRHRAALGSTDEATLLARIVGVADAYDVLTQVGVPGGHLEAPTRAREIVLAAVVDPEISRALDHALTRRGDGGGRR
ncbi:HD domain-containing phosphohydrolase [Arthrobacter sp. NEB 688]|uniref:HD-GYP domain-containing protein n=1 Tax=Arthrobacter sp. NEB 688 TaxID=904039 RepID=UPI001567270A|nr:HD domain-containing phosphohydrolase [Arthrobacter sp. NEB 688]QKE84056.1 HD domain-containing protein [Arthrobacter sp. NEB 688]